MHHSTRKRLASKFWPRFSPKVEILNRNAQMLTSVRGYESKGIEVFKERVEMYSALNGKLANAAITYLEFGVWKGASLRAWTSINTNQDSRFYGFDSFEGLPEEWVHFGSTMKKERFDLGGDIPSIADSRAGLINGWFQKTLRNFLRDTPISHPIVINNDSDLHSSTLYTLCTLDPVLQAGDIIIFDEYSSASNEYLAWEEYKRAFGRSAECVAMSDRWTQAAFVLT
jgi:O-methyltransferase